MRLIRPFIRTIGISRIAMLGAALTTAAFVGDVILILGEMFLFLSNPYIGMVAYMLLPGLMMLGLVIIPIGIWWRLRRTGQRMSWPTIKALIDSDEQVHRPGHIVQIIGLLTAVNLVAFSVVGYRSYHFMDSTAFCGLLCHQVMAPEYTTYQRSPHSRVECVQCHIGPGAGWFVKSKISGARQVLAVTFDTYEKPIPTPIENLRPAREVCEVCHRPELFHGNIIRQIEHFLPDEQNSRRYTVLNMRVGGGDGQGRVASGIHWHVSKQHTLRYYATDHKREDVVWIQQLDEHGEVEHTWTRPNGPQVDVDQVKQKDLRTMDCVDCHNRPTHIYLPPAQAIDERMQTGELDPNLPWIRKVAEEVLTATYASHADAMTGIERQTLEIYQQQYPNVWAAQETQVRHAVDVLCDIYRTFVWPSMHIGWNTYPSLIGHPDSHSKRCFRCHDGLMRDESGRQIPITCKTCHYVLARDSSDPPINKVLRGQPALYSK